MIGRVSNFMLGSDMGCLPPISGPPSQAPHLRPPTSGPPSQGPQFRPPILDPPSQTPMSDPPFQTPHLRVPILDPLAQTPHLRSQASHIGLPSTSRTLHIYIKTSRMNLTLSQRGFISFHFFFHFFFFIFGTHNAIQA